MLIVRLKQCEFALAGGLLDEAYDIVRTPAVRAHRRGQTLATKVATALVDRGNKHLAAGRLPEAAADAERATALAGDTPAVAQLRSAATAALRHRDHAHRQAGQLVAAVRNHVARGELSVAERLLHNDNDPPDPALRRELDAARATVDSAVTKAKAALKSDAPTDAVAFLATVPRGSDRDPAVREICREIEDRLVTEAKTAFESGRLDAAARLAAQLARLPVKGPAADEVQAAIDQSRAAYHAIQTGKFRDADESLRRLAGVWPKARWLTDAVAHAAKVVEGLDELRVGPLSLTDPHTPAAAHAPVDRKPLFPQPRTTPTPTEKLVLHVDGVGTFLLCTGDAVTIGPASASRPVDVPVMVDAATAAVTITRADGDYFARGSTGRPVTVNDMDTPHKLLRPADRIALGPRARVTFRRPSTASGSAVLDLAAARTPGPAVRQVILMDREFIIGPGAAAHVRADDLPAAIVVQLKDGNRWTCKSAAEVTIDDHPAGRAADFAPGQRVAAGPVGFVVVREGHA